MAKARGIGDTKDWQISQVGKMRKEVIDHLTSVIITSILKHGASYMKHLPEMFENWEGPLDEDNIFLNKNLIINFRKKNAENIMGRLKDLSIHPIFNRDFFKGVMDGLGNPSNSRRICFYGRPALRSFLESSEHPFKIEFGETYVPRRNRTKSLNFLSLPFNGELDKYFAGALSSSVLFEDSGEAFCLMNHRCSKILKNLGILYKEVDKGVIVTPFYLMIFSGDIPESVFREWFKTLSRPEFSNMKSSSLDSLMNWKLVFGHKAFRSGSLPYLQSRTYYYESMGMTSEKLCKYIAEKQFDFVDERVRNRIKRWYNTTIPISGPISSPTSA